jgi:hypothetical protein
VTHHSYYKNSKHALLALWTLKLILTKHSLHYHVRFNVDHVSSGCYLYFHALPQNSNTNVQSILVTGAHVNTHSSVITAELLQNAWDEASEKWIVRNVWTAKQVEAYFKVLTINDATIDKFVNQGRRCQLATAFRNNPNVVSNLVLQRELQVSMDKHPSNFTKPSSPPMWKIVELDYLPEAVMHLAMGVVKAVAKFIHGWASSRNRSPYLTELMNFCINMHRRYCRIGRCPMATYSQLGKFPGWVADTFRSWWIWMPWFYSSLANATFQYSNYVLPTTPPSQWNGAVCSQFLKSRGYPGYSKLNANEKQKVVLEMSLREDWPSTEVIPVVCAVTGIELQKLVWHCHALFKNMFAEPSTNIQSHAADCHSKLLLSTITKLDRLMQVNDNQPNLYEAKYNFISLPRAVRLMSIFGSARNIQEGGVDGEGVVKLLRPLTPQGLKQHFAKNLINAFHRDQQLGNFCEELATHHRVDLLQDGTTPSAKGMQLLIDSAELELTTTDDVMYNGVEVDEDKHHEELFLHDTDQGSQADNEPDIVDEEFHTAFALDSQQYKRYKSWPLLQELHDLGLPISFVIAVVHGHSCIGCILGSGKSGKLVPVRVGQVRANTRYRFTYFETKLNSDKGSWIELYSCDNDGTPREHHSVVNYGHLLPQLALMESTSRTSPIPYTVVTTDAKHMNEMYSFV